MRYLDYLSEQRKFTKWVNYTPDSLSSDFAEYKKKEERKWKTRAQAIGARFPIFKDFPEFTQALKKAKVKKLFKGEAQKIGNVSLNDELFGVRKMVSHYDTPRDVDKIVKGFESNTKMPMPIILKGKTDNFIMAGNTRLNVAYIMGILPQVLVVDVSE
jgi:hypothetical protein